MTIEFELGLCDNNGFNQVDSLNDDLVNLLIHAHFDELVECHLKPLLLSVDSRYVLDDLLKSRLSHLPLRAL